MSLLACQQPVIKYIGIYVVTDLWVPLTSLNPTPIFSPPIKVTITVNGAMCPAQDCHFFPGRPTLACPTFISRRPSNIFGILDQVQPHHVVPLFSGTRMTKSAPASTGENSTLFWATL